MFSVKVEEGRKGRDGNLSVGPVYRNLLAENGFPSPDPDMCTAWDVFRYFTVGTQFARISRLNGFRDFIKLSLIQSLLNYVNTSAMDTNKIYPIITMGVDPNQTLGVGYGSVSLIFLFMPNRP